VSEARHTTIAGLSRLVIHAPDPSNGADSLRISPWPAADLRTPLRPFVIEDIVAYAKEINTWTLYVSLDDSLGEKDKGPRHLAAVAYHHDHPKSQGKQQPSDTNGTVPVEGRFELGMRSYVYDWRLSLREKTVRRLNRERVPAQRLRFRKTTTLARERLGELQQLLPPGFQVSVLFDSGYAANRLRTCCRRQGWHVVWAIKANRKLDDQKLSQWPQALRHQRYQRVQLTATDGRQRLSLVRPVQGRLPPLSFDVGGLISKRHPRDKHPKYVLCTDLALSAQHILSIYHKRWPVEVDHFSVKQPLGLADLRVQSYEATEKWLAVVLLAVVFLPWRFNHAHAQEPWHSLAEVVRQHRYEHARTLLETACQEAATVRDYRPIFQRFLCQPT
jgi:Transposase DDE domain